MTSKSWLENRMLILYHTWWASKLHPRSYTISSPIRKKATWIRDTWTQAFYQSNHFSLSWRCIPYLPLGFPSFLFLSCCCLGTLPWWVIFLMSISTSRFWVLLEKAPEHKFWKYLWPFCSRQANNSTLRDRNYRRWIRRIKTHPSPQMDMKGGKVKMCPREAMDLHPHFQIWVRFTHSWWASRCTYSRDRFRCIRTSAWQKAPLGRQ